MKSDQLEVCDNIYGGSSGGKLDSGDIWMVETFFWDSLEVLEVMVEMGRTFGCTIVGLKEG